MYDEEAKQGYEASLIETAIWYLAFLDPLNSSKVQILHRIWNDIAHGRYMPVLENRAVMEFPKMLCKLLQNGGQLTLDGDLEIETNEDGRPVRYTIRDGANKKFPASAVALLLVLCNKLLTASSNKVLLSLAEYQERIQSDSYESTRKRALRELNALRDLDTRYEEKHNGRWTDCGGYERICTGLARIKGGNIEFGFGEDFAKSLRENNTTMDVRARTLQLNPKSSAFFFALYFDIDYRRNIGNKKRLGHAKVTTLLESTPYIQDFDHVRDSRGSVYQKIIKPFFDAMDKTGLPYKVVGPFKEVVEDPRHMLLEDFLHSTVHVDTSVYPANQQLIVAKAARKERTEKKAGKDKNRKNGNN
jgi:hypothetical protein